VSRPLRVTVVAVPLILFAAASFVLGQSLRHSVALPERFAHLENRVSSLPEAGIGGTSDAASPPQDVAPEDTFNEVLRYVRSDYVERVDDEKRLGFGAVKTMLASLDDPKTRFYDPVQRKQLLDQLSGRYAGIGATLTVVKQRRGVGSGAIDQRRLAVLAPAPGSPAESAGLKPSDIITEIDGRWVIAYDPRLEIDSQSAPELPGQAPDSATQAATDRLAKGISLPKALDLLNTADSKALTLTVERAGAARPVKVLVNPAAGTYDPVEVHDLGNGAAYLRVTQFSDHATDEFCAALAATKASTLVLDLRNNCSGPVNSRVSGPLGSALTLAGKLAGPGIIASVARRANKVEPLNSSAACAGHYRIVVLVNGGTANLAEMVAASLKERVHASLVGSRTFGDSVYQKLVELRDGAGMTVTTGKLMTARGLDFPGRGLGVDVSIESNRPSWNDAAVQRALAAG
jgi:carboxyl-terminal processing protease